MSFATPITVSVHKVTLTASSTPRAMRSDRLMPQLQVGPDAPGQLTAARLCRLGTLLSSRNRTQRQELRRNSRAQSSESTSGELVGQKDK